MICELTPKIKNIIIVEVKRLEFKLEDKSYLEIGLGDIHPLRFYIESIDTFGSVFDDFITFVRSCADQWDEYILVYNEDKYKEMLDDPFYKSIKDIKIYDKINDHWTDEIKKKIIAKFFTSAALKCFKAYYKPNNDKGVLVNGII